MAGERQPAPEYRTARIAAAILLFAVVGFITILDAFRADFEVNPLVLVPILAIGAGLLAVEVPWVNKR